MHRPAALAAAVLALAPGAMAGTWYVDVNGVPPGTGTQADPYTSIAYALAQPATVSGDVVLVSPGTYLENVVFPGRGVAVRSTGGSSMTVIDAGGSGSAVSFLGTDGSYMSLGGFTVTGGSGTQPGALRLGGGVYALDAMYEVYDCIVTANDAFWGGGLYAENGVGWIGAGSISSNTSTGQGCLGAGIAINGGMATLRTLTIDSNVAGDYTLVGRGGGIATFNAGTVDARDCQITDNWAELGGGGISGNGTLDACLVARNSGQFGGGVEVQVGSGTMQILNCVIEDNWAFSATGTANFGGGIWGAAIVTDTLIRNNVAVGSAGGVDGFLQGATLLDCQVIGNQGFDGFGFDSVVGGVADGLLIDCVIAENEATGGFIAPARGGGVASSFLADCVVRDNTATSLGLATGAGLNECNAKRTRIHGNALLAGSNGTRGGGAFGGSLFRCEIFGNSAELGGGAADSFLDRCTVWGNSGATIGGVYAEFLATVHDSILWNNGDELGSGVNGQVTVTFSDVEGGSAGAGNIDADPRFWNAPGGDFHLRKSSPCIDAGDPTSKLDPDGTRADMGARFFQASYYGTLGRVKHP